jgi:hypothetical protein
LQQSDTDLQHSQFIWLKRSPTIEILTPQTQAFRRRAIFAWRTFCHIRIGQTMVSKIIAVSVLGFCAVATVAWTTFLGWGLYELLH